MTGTQRGVQCAGGMEETFKLATTLHFYMFLYQLPNVQLCHGNHNSGYNKGLIWSSHDYHTTYRREEDVVAKEVVSVLLIIKIAKLS